VSKVVVTDDKKKLRIRNKTKIQIKLRSVCICQRVDENEAKIKLLKPEFKTILTLKFLSGLKER
jgi:hypothetical protein